MIVCVCNGLNERKVRQALNTNGGCAVGVYRDLGCRPRCGKCVEHVYAMARDARTDSESQEALA